MVMLGSHLVRVYLHHDLPSIFFSLFLWYIQQLREGVHNFFATFIKVLRNRPPGHDWALEPGVTCGDYLFGMLQGTRSAPYANGRESITVTVQEVTPRSVGALIALYERAVGVEAGKKAAGEVLALQKRVLSVLNEARVCFLRSSTICFTLHLRNARLLQWGRGRDRGSGLLASFEIYTYQIGFGGDKQVAADQKTMAVDNMVSKEITEEIGKEKDIVNNTSDT